MTEKSQKKSQKTKCGAVRPKKKMETSETLEQCTAAVARQVSQTA